ncbi:MAG: OmpH family outer membrane protein [Candidatus Aminicenantes bacterium]|nr:OmpH family outer membrane protein [Candidatus Aminicenantes bacterium]
MTRQTRTLTLLALAGSTFVLTATAWAQTSKIAVINSPAAFQTSVEGKRAASQFQTREDKIKGDLARIDNELRALETRLSTQRLTLTNEAVVQLQADFDRKTTERKRTEEDATRDYQQFQMNVMQKIRSDMIAIVSQIAQERGFDAVLDVAASGIVYFNQTIDITGEVVRRYDASKAASPQKK